MWHLDLSQLEPGGVAAAAKAATAATDAAMASGGAAAGSAAASLLPFGGLRLPRAEQQAAADAAAAGEVQSTGAQQLVLALAASQQAAAELAAELAGAQRERGALLRRLHSAEHRLPSHHHPGPGARAQAGAGSTLGEGCTEAAAVARDPPPAPPAGLPLPAGAAQPSMQQLLGGLSSLATDLGAGAASDSGPAAGSLAAGGASEGWGPPAATRQLLHYCAELQVRLHPRACVPSTGE